MMINVNKLTNELLAVGIKTCGCNESGVVWDDNNNEIQTRPDVAAIITAHDPTPVPLLPTLDKQIKELQAQVKVLLAKVK